MENNINQLLLLNSIDAIFEPHEWLTPEIRPIKTSDGATLAYCAITTQTKVRTRKNLPDEFFNHEMKRVDIHNADDFADFMSCYGAFRCLWKPTLKTSREISRAIKEFEAINLEQISRFEKQTGFLPYETIMQDISPQSRLEFYSLLQPALMAALGKLDDANKTIGANILNELHISEIFSPWQATHAFENWLYAADYIKALLASSSCEDIALRIGIERFSVARNAAGAMNIINEKLKAISPRIDLLESDSDMILPTKGRKVRGSVEEAIALQLWKMTILGKQGAFICKECGDVFVTKRSNSRKRSPRSTSLFCCDRCKNRFTQRKHRESPAYRNKKTHSS